MRLYAVLGAGGGPGSARASGVPSLAQGRPRTRWLSLCIILEGRGSVHRSSPTSQAEVQMEAWGPRGFAVTSTGASQALPVELDQAEWEISQDPSI